MQMKGAVSSSPPSVAVVRADHIGDLVLTTPMIRALAENGWEVDVIGGLGIIELLRGNPHTRELFSLQEIAPGWPRAWWRLGRFLARRNYDAVLLPYAHPRRLLLASALSGAPRKIAMWGGILGRITRHECVRSHFLNEVRPYASTVMRILSPLGIQGGNLHPNLYLTQAEIENAHEYLNQKLAKGIRIAIHPVGLGNACNLPLSTYRELLEIVLRRTDWKIVITGSEADRLKVIEWQRISAAAEGRLRIACGETDLRSLTAILHEVNAMVVASTGPLHLAAAVGTPTITAFCPQLPVCSGIWGHSPLELSSIEPFPPPCDASKIHGAHCDFRGTVTAADLFTRLEHIVVGPAGSDEFKRDA